MRWTRSGSRPGVGVHLLDGGEVGEGLHAVPPVHVDPADFPELRAQLLDEAPRDVGPGLEHPVLDARSGWSRQHAGGLAMARLERHALAAEIQEEEQAEPQDQDADDEREHLGPEALAEEVSHAHRAPARRSRERRAATAVRRRIVLGYKARSIAGPCAGRSVRVASMLVTWRAHVRGFSRLTHRD